MTLPTSSIGLDFSKLKFDFLLSPKQRGVLPNDRAGFSRLFARLPPGAHLVCESTGPYHRALVRAAQQQGWPVTVANPAQVRHFIKGQGQQAKTDALDAQYLQLFGQSTQPKADPVPAPAQLALESLVVARQQTVLEHSTLQVQAGLPDLHPFVLRQFKTRLRLLGHQIALLEAEMQKTITQDSLLNAKFHASLRSPASAPSPRPPLWLFARSSALSPAINPPLSSASLPSQTTAAISASLVTSRVAASASALRRLHGRSFRRSP